MWNRTRGRPPTATAHRSASARSCPGAGTRCSRGKGVARAGALESRRDTLGRFGRGDDGHNLEIDQITPRRHPLVEQPAIVAFHDLVALRHVCRDPARDVLQAVGRQPSALAETPVHRRGIFEGLDDHVEHRSPYLMAYTVYPTCEPARRP